MTQRSWVQILKATSPFAGVRFCTPTLPRPHQVEALCIGPPFQMAPIKATLMDDPEDLNHSINRQAAIAQQSEAEGPKKEKGKEKA